MPVLLDNPNQREGRQTREGSLMEVSDKNLYAYSYPEGLDLRPSSDLHKRLLSEIQYRLKASADNMEKRHERWGKIEWTLNAFVPLDKEEQRIKANDPRKPVSIVIPVSYATREVMLTYLTAAYFGDYPMIPFEPRSPEDIIPVALMEMLVDYQRHIKKWELALHTMWGDAISYGFGVVAASWQIDYAWKTIRKQRGIRSLLSNLFIPMGYEKDREQYVSFEGNVLDAIDPWLYFPDPNAPAHMPEKMEFVAWVVPTNVPAILSQEQQGVFFNGQYLMHSGDCRSKNLRKGNRENSEDRSAARPADITWIHWNLIPSEQRLGTSDYPETWLFAVGGDEVILWGGPLSLDHNRAPIVTCAFDTDGRTSLPTSKLEIGYGLQETIDWMVSSHVKYTRKMANGAFAYDPSMYNAAALQAISETGGAVPTRRTMWGRSVKDGIMQLPFDSNATRGNISDAEYLMGVKQRVEGSGDIVQGIMRDGGERRSATEARGARSSALSRLEHSAKIFSIQTMRDLGMIVAKQTQQFMSEEIAMRILGRNADKLNQIYGKDGFAYVSPFDILCEFDVVPRDGTLPNPDNANTLLMMMQTIMNSPVASRYSIDKMIKGIAYHSGIKDISSFEIDVVDDATVQEELNAGNLTTAGSVIR